MTTTRGDGRAQHPAVDDSAVRDALLAVRVFSDAMDRMHSSLKGELEMNATDVAAIRMLVIREQRGEDVSPHDIARHLRISTASTSKLLDRLSEAGHVVRVAHPKDRRVRIIMLTEKSRAVFERSLRESIETMRSVAREYSGAELRVVVDFLTKLSAAIAPAS